MTEPLTVSPPLNGFSVSESRLLPVSEEATIIAGISFLLLRYTARQEIKLPNLCNGSTRVRTWNIQSDTSLFELTEGFEELPWTKEPANAETKYSPWNPLFLESQNEEELEAQLAEVDLNDIPTTIIFCVAKSPEPSCRIYSSIPNCSEGYLDQILGHWLQSIHLINTIPKTVAISQCILTEEEYDLMIRKWNATEIATVDGKFGFEEFDNRVNELPDSIAISSTEGQLTYKELQIKANQLAHYLQSIGVGPEVVVGIYLTRSIEFVVSLVALKKSGGAFLPLDPDHPKERKEFLISDSKVTFIISSEQWAKSLPEGSYQCIILEDIEKDLRRMPTQTPQHGLKEGNMSYLFYTSGSTGQPKGVMMTMGYQLKPAEPLSTRSNPGPQKVMLKSSTGFTLILLETFTPLTSGGQIVVVPKGRETDGQYMVRKVIEDGVETLNLVPSMLSILLLQDDIEKCTSLKKVYTVGERLPVPVQRDFFKKLPHARLYVFYGCTEAPAATFREILPDEDFGNRVVLGKPKSQRKVYILDPFGVPVPAGVVGEIFVGGNISRGYIHNEQLTKERFLPNPFTGYDGDRMYQTGDLGRFLNDGSLEYIGRTDFQVQIRGIRIELGEIEACLMKDSRIIEAVVIARKSQNNNTILVAYYTCTSDERPNDSALRAHVRNSLPDYMTPARFIALDKLPLNTSGKIDRLNFPEPESIAIVHDGEQVFEGYSSVQTILRTIFFKTLGISQFLNSDSFFDVGGDSLLAVLAINRINKQFDVKLSLPDFIENSSVLALEELLQNKGYKSKFDLLVKIRTQVGKLNLFMVSTNVSVESYLCEDWNIYILRGLWHNERFDFSKTLDQTADDYVKEILMVQAEGPYYLAGYSMGGTLAHQIACKLQSLGHKIALLHLIDPTPPLKPVRKHATRNISAFWLHLKTHRFRHGPGIVFSYFLNMIGLKPLVRHRFSLANDYTRTLVFLSTFKRFRGDAHLYYRTNYGQENLEAWDKLISGTISTMELDTTDHHAVDRYPIQEVWCENIIP